MKNEFTICVRAFPVRVYDHKTQTERERISAAPNRSGNC